MIKISMDRTLPGCGYEQKCPVLTGGWLPHRGDGGL